MKISSESNAVYFGFIHGSCPEAMEWRKSLGEEATQSDAWRCCKRGDWLLWQWRRLPNNVRDATRPAIQRAIESIIARSIRRGMRLLRGCREPWVREWRYWARRWLSGEDRSQIASRVALDVALKAMMVVDRKTEAQKLTACDVAWKSAQAAVDIDEAWITISMDFYEREMRLQARDIHREIPEWPQEI